MCVSVCSSGAIILQTQHSGDHLNFTWNTHDPPGCAAVGAISEVLLLSLTERLTWRLTQTHMHSFMHAAPHRLPTAHLRRLYFLCASVRCH